MAWLRLIRWKNLLIIFFTQLLAWWCVVWPERPLVVTPANFFLLTVSTIFIAAAGYIINDYFDIKIDLINRPEKVVLENEIPRKQAIISHFVLNAAALILACIVAVKAQHPEWLLFQVMCILLLWFYSTHFKRQYVTGNVTVALLTSSTIIVFIVYEPRVQHALYRHLNMPGLMRGELYSSNPFWALMVVAYFAFMLTWMREIVKDMEDRKGDEDEGCVTMPVKKGLVYSRNFVRSLSLLVVIPLLLGSLILYRLHYALLSFYFITFVAAPLIIWTIFFYRKQGTGHYHAASTGLKILMTLGIFSFLIYFILNCVT